MANIIGDLVYRITGDTSKLNTTLKQTDKEVKKASGGIGVLTGAITKLGGAIAATFAVQKIIAFGKEAINAASTAAETANKFAVTFSGISISADQATNRLIKTYKLAKSEVQGLLASTGDLLTGFGFSQTEALKTAESVVALSSDLASFQNIAGGTEEVVRRVNAALTGETEGLKSLGIVVRQDSIDFINLVKSIKDSTGVSDQLAKSQAILQVALSQSKNAIGDTLRTQEDYANQTRILQSNIKTLAEDIGRTFIPVVKEGVKFLNQLFDGRNKDQNIAIDREKEFAQLTNEQLNERLKANTAILIGYEDQKKFFDDLLSSQQISNKDYKKALAEIESKTKVLLDIDTAITKEQDKRIQNTEAAKKDEAERARIEYEKELARLKEIDNKKKEINNTIRTELDNLRIDRENDTITSEEEAEKTKQIFLSAIEQARKLFGSGDKFTQDLTNYFIALRGNTKEIKAEIDKSVESFKLIGEIIKGINFGENEGLANFANSVVTLTKAIKDNQSASKENQLQASDWVGLIVQVANALEQLTEQASNKLFDKGNEGAGRFFKTLNDILKVGLDIKYVMISLIPVIGVALAFVKRFQDSTKESTDVVDEQLSTLSDGVDSYVSSLESGLLDKALDIWAEYAKGAIEELSGINTYIAENEAIDEARAKRKADAEKAILQDVLNSNASETDKALAQEELTYIQNEEKIAQIKKDNAEKEKELEKNLQLVKLAIKKSAFESEIQIKLAELEADQASAIAGTEKIVIPSKRKDAQKRIKSAYNDAFSAIGKASGNAAQSFELERQSITGELDASDFTGTNALINKSLTEMSQPIVITLDGKDIAKSTLKYFNNGLVEGSAQ